MDLDSLRNTLREELRKIDGAVADCFVTHKAEAELVHSYVDNTVEEVDRFLRKARELRFLNGARMKVDMLKVALANCLTYVEDRSCASVYQYMITSASKPSSETSYSVTSQDLENEAKAAVQEGIIEPVIVLVERALKRGGAPLHQRAIGSSAVELMYAIEDMDRVLCFGHSDMATYDTRINDERKLDVVVRSVQRYVSSHNLLLAKLDLLAEAVDAMRVTLEKDACPLVFFMTPPAATKGTWWDKARRKSLLSERMDLHFVCRVFFEDLRKALSQGSNVTTRPIPMTSSEFSLPIEVKQPRKYITKLKPVIKLSLLVINLITHAAASGIGIGGFIPDLNLSDHEELLDIMQGHLEDLDRKTETDLPSEDDTDAHGSDVLPGLKLLHAGARESMQIYLEKHHKAEWKEPVHANLRIALNKKNDCAFICKNNPRHETEWESSG